MELWLRPRAMITTARIDKRPVLIAIAHPVRRCAVTGRMVPVGTTARKPVVPMIPKAVVAPMVPTVARIMRRCRRNPGRRLATATTPATKSDIAMPARTAPTGAGVTS